MPEIRMRWKIMLNVAVYIFLYIVVVNVVVNVVVFSQLQIISECGNENIYIIQIHSESSYKSIIRITKTTSMYINVFLNEERM